jgi:hypothetical protein
MAFNSKLFLAYWQLTASVVVLIVLIMAILRYRVKKSEIARELIGAFSFFFLAAVFQTIGSMFGLYGISATGSTHIGYPNWIINFFIQQLTSYQIAYYSLIIGFYFIYRFSQCLIRKEGDKSKVSMYIVPIWMILIILFGLLKTQIDFPPMGDIGSIIIGVDIWVVIYSLFVLFPILNESIRLRRKIEKEDPSFTKISYLVAMAIAMIILIICFVLETIYSIISDNWNPNIFSFIAWIFVIFGLFVGYQALYKK